jgi:hypothetical protein
MSDWLRRLFTPFQSSPRRWALVGALLAVMLVLALTGNLP